MEEIEKQENTVFANTLPLEEKIASPSTEFAVGQLVGLRSDPTRVGAIINVLPGTLLFITIDGRFFITLCVTHFGH